MIELHYAPTPNGHKIAIALEELGLDYEVHRVNIGEGDQFKPEFLAFSPNNRIPAIIDHGADGDEPVTVFESGAILVYLAEKTGRLMPASGDGRKTVMEWLMWQMGGFGPMLGQAHHFLHFNPSKAPYAEERYGKEAERLYRVLDRQLETHEFVAGAYSIADMSIWPWASRFEWQGIDLADYPNVRRWYLDVAGRPAVQRGYDVPAKTNPIPLPA